MLGNLPARIKIKTIMRRQICQCKMKWKRLWVVWISSTIKNEINTSMCWQICLHKKWNERFYVLASLSAQKTTWGFWCAGSKMKWELLCVGKFASTKTEWKLLCAGKLASTENEINICMCWQICQHKKKKWRPFMDWVICQHRNGMEIVMCWQTSQHKRKWKLLYAGKLGSAKN